MARGGRRKGAGRKFGYKAPQTYLAGKAKEQLIQRILNEWTNLIDTKLRIALGDYYVESKNNEKRLVYRAKPDPKSINDLISFVVGKPTQPIENNIQGSIESPSLKQLTQDIRAILEGKQL